MKTFSKVIACLLAVSLAGGLVYYYTRPTCTEGIIDDFRQEVKKSRNRPGMTYGDDLPFELGNITFEEGNWDYSDSSDYIRLPETYTLELKKGDGIIMEDGSYEYCVGIKTADGSLKNTAWINGLNGYVVPNDGQYSIVIKHNSSFKEGEEEEFIQNVASSLRVYDNHSEDIQTHLFPDDYTYTCGHRSGGNAGSSPIDVPENSLLGLEVYASQGYWGVECDVRVTADDDWILCHNGTVDATTDHYGNVHDYTLAELQTFHLQKKGVFSDQTMPSIYQWLDRCKELGVVPVIEIENDHFVEEKHVQKLVDALVERGMEKDAIILSFGYEPLCFVKKYNRSIVTFLLTYEFPSMDSEGIYDQAFSNLAVYGNTGIFVNQNQPTVPLSPERSDFAHEYGLYVGSWASYPYNRNLTIPTLYCHLNLCCAEMCPDIMTILN